MLVKMLKPNDVLKVSAFGTLGFSPMCETSDDQTPETGCIAVCVGFHSRPPVLHVGGASVLLNRTNCVFTVLPNSWFKIDGVGIKVFTTDKDGKPFPEGTIRVIIDSPAEVEIHKC